VRVREDGSGGSSCEEEGLESSEAQEVGEHEEREVEEGGY